jgi:hypothetical protein
MPTAWLAIYAGCCCDDDYAAAGKPAWDYDDPAAREQTVDALARDARAALDALAGRQLEPALAVAVELLASVTGQDLEQNGAGVFRIARRVVPDRVISTVDTQARHGHKTRHRSFDGYKGYIAVDPDAEIMTADRQQRRRWQPGGPARRRAALCRR